MYIYIFYRQRVGNMELLRYQLQTERDKAAALEEKVAALNQVTLNSEVGVASVIKN